MLIRKRENGSITLEAALILPLFITFILLLTTMIRVAIVDIALTNAVSETTKQLSTHMYPVNLAYNQFLQTDLGKELGETKEQADELLSQYNQVKEFLSAYSYMLPKEVEVLLTAAEQLEEEVSTAYNQVLGSAFKPILAQYIDQRLIHLDSLRIVNVVLPSFADQEKAYLGLEVKYEMPLNLSFTDKTLVFKKKAYEGVWVGDGQLQLSSSSPANNNTDPSIGEEGQDEDSGNVDQKIKLYIVSVTSPVQRGHYVTVVAKGPPNKTAKIQLKYASSFQKEEYLRFDDDGWLSNSQIIGGNANEGIYTATVSADGQKASIHFEVMSKDNFHKYKNDR